MTCQVCGGQFEKLFTNLPFKVGDKSIVILKNLPVLQCRNCAEYVIEDAVVERTEAVLSDIDATIELEVLRYVT